MLSNWKEAEGVSVCPPAELFQRMQLSKVVVRLP